MAQVLELRSEGPYDQGHDGLLKTESWIRLTLDLRSENSGCLGSSVILIRVVYSVSIESHMDWIDLGTLGPLEQADSCNMGLKEEPKAR